MDDKDYLDKVIKNVIDDSISNIEASRDIFNEAWNKKGEEMSKKRYFNIKYMKKAVLVPACCAALALIGVFTFSAGARVAAQEALRTIFLPDKSGKIVEKSDDTLVPVATGAVELTNKNKEAMERRFGFKINLPEKIGNYSYVYAPNVMIMADDVKYKDANTITDKLYKAIDDDKVFEELEKKYKLERMLIASYKDNHGHKFQVIPIKENGKSKKHNEDIFKEVTIDDIKCTIAQDREFKYNVKEDKDGNGVTDLEHKPVSTQNRYDMSWSYDGINYGIAIGSKSSDVDAAIQFAKDYIKILKQK